MIELPNQGDNIISCLKSPMEGEFVKLKDKMPIVIVLVGNLSLRGGREIRDLV
jgi:hypothetical protein